MPSLSPMKLLVVAIYVISSTQCQNWHFSGPNIALNKPATNYPKNLVDNETGYINAAGKAVDGNTGTDRKGGQGCSITEFNYLAEAYWKVSLGGLFILKGIEMFNLYPSFGRLEHFAVIGDPGTVILYNDSSVSSQLYNETEISIPITSTVPFREVTVKVPAKLDNKGFDIGFSMVGLCEVLLYAAMQGCISIQNTQDLDWTIKQNTGYLNSTYNMVKVGTELIFTCKDPTFRVNGTTNFTCLENGSYTETLPTCTEIICPMPPASINDGNYTNIVKQKYTKGDVITVKCHDGYKPQQPQSRECLDDSTWSESEPTCILIICSFPNTFTHGTLNYTNGNVYSVGVVPIRTIIHITCDEGYVAESNSSQCTTEGVWDILPKCTLIECESLGDLPGGVYIYTNDTIAGKQTYAFGTAAHVKCSSNSYTSGGENATVVCGQYGNWQGNVSECACPSLPVSVNGGNYTHDLKENYAYNDTIILQCYNGYTPQQPQSRECSHNLTWSGEEFACVEITCAFPNTFTDGKLLNNSVEYSYGYITHGINIQVYCDEGYVADSNSIQCTTDGKWDKLPKCTLIECKSLGDLPGGFYVYTSDPIDGNQTYVFGTVAFVDCFNMYTRVGEKLTFTCGKDGNWQGNISKCVDLTEQKQTPESMTGVIVGAVVGPVLLISGVSIAVIVFLHKRKRQAGSNTNHEPEKTGYIRNSFASLKYEHPVDVCAEKDNTSNGIPASDDQYYSFGDLNSLSETTIQLSNLVEFVFNIESCSDKFTKEFGSLPQGLQRPYSAASKAKGKNRYRNLYAYDDTRVVLDVWDKKSDTDYINACYVHGFNRTKAYIASQGPTFDILNDFWRMIWQKNCRNIVMLTKLKEHGKMKSERYWPEMGSEKYGHLTVRMVKTDALSNFVIRTLDVSKAGEKTSRTVTHFHFTSWPDKDVPLFCSSLVHFHNKVKENVQPSEGPMVVHCSAGIGRTGTFIALDYLFDQGHELDYIDVLGCVRALRQQRVNMVQTKSQYVYVHLAMTEIFALKTSVVSSSKFEEQYNTLLKRDEINQQRPIDTEYKLMKKMSVSCEDDRTPEQKENAPKVEDYMPSLSQPGHYLFGEYIDAAFLPIYKEDNALIITRAPTETTLEDFLKLIYHQAVHTIVMMNNGSQCHAAQKYWTNGDESKKVGDFAIVAKKVTRRNEHAILSLTITKHKKERDIQLIQFGGWKDDKSVPDNADGILSVVEYVEDYQRQTGNHPILVHCMDGVERSGLFCVIVSLLDRTKIEQDVAISQVIQEMRSRRPNVIPNVDQFEFCHEVILSFLHKHETYSNFVLNE